jgi:hypothetical protein
MQVVMLGVHCGTGGLKCRHDVMLCRAYLDRRMSWFQKAGQSWTRVLAQDAARCWRVDHLTHS